MYDFHKPSNSVYLFLVDKTIEIADISRPMQNKDLLERQARKFGEVSYRQPFHYSSHLNAKCIGDHMQMNLNVESDSQ